MTFGGITLRYGLYCNHAGLTVLARAVTHIPLGKAVICHSEQGAVATSAKNLVVGTAFKIQIIPLQKEQFGTLERLVLRGRALVRLKLKSSKNSRSSFATSSKTTVSQWTLFI